MNKIKQYFDLMKDIEENLLSYIEDNNEDNDNLFNYFEERKINENKQEFKSFLYLIVHLSNNYHRTRNLYDKIDRLISHFKDSIQKNFQNSEIFHIFQSNKRILLFLIQQRILTINQSIFEIINQRKFKEMYYIEYFFPEIERFLQEPIKITIKKNIKELNEKDLESFNKKRKQGENDNIICSYIRNDQVIDFITYLEKANISPSSNIEYSIYETNPLLLKYKIIDESCPLVFRDKSKTLIEYSAFFGSQQILVYLVKKGAKISNSIWPYIIHGKNPELIHYLEENKVQTLQKSYQYLIVESIKCHHNEIADYLLNNFSHKEHIYKEYLLKKHLKYYNYNLEKYKIQKIINLSLKSDLFYYFCKYDYFRVIQFLLTIPELNVNQQYKIYKPHVEPDEIILSIDIKNGNLKKIPKEKKRMIKNKNPEKTEYELENNYYVNIYDLEITSSLIVSTQKGNIDIIQLLLNSKEIDTNIKSKNYHKGYYNHNGFLTIIEEKTLLHEAIENDHADVVRILLTLGKFNMNDNFIITEKYIDSRSSACWHVQNEYLKTPLVLASELGYSEIMQILLLQGKADINQKSFDKKYESGGCEYFTETFIKIEKTALHVAIENENLYTIKICLEQPNIDVNIPYLIIDLKEKKKRQFNDLDPIDKKITTLNLAVLRCNNIDVFRLLLNQPNIDINMKSIQIINRYDDSKSIRTPLHNAVIMKKTEIIQLLLQQKAIDVNALDEKNRKPIDCTDDKTIKKLFKKLHK